MKLNLGQSSVSPEVKEETKRKQMRMKGFSYCFSSNSEVRKNLKIE